MGYSRIDKQKTHDRIIEIAAMRFRERGLDGLSISDLMTEAGLTNGGFYKHFATREDLVSQSVAKALEYKNLESAEDTSDNRLIDFVLDYLSTLHRDNPGTGCAVGGLVNDVVRASDETRAAYTAQVAENIAALQAALETFKSGNRRSFAINAISSMTGALCLARAVSNDHLSLEILDTVRDNLLKSISEIVTKPEE